MTVNKIETVQHLIKEMQADGTGVGSAWAYKNGMNKKKMFAVFAPSAVCDIFDSPFVQNPKQIWADGKYLGEYANLN